MEADCELLCGSGVVTNSIEEIRRRLKAYKAHYNDPYSYDQREITEVREFHDSAPADIEFLLKQVEDFR